MMLSVFVKEGNSLAIGMRHLPLMYISPEPVLYNCTWMKCIRWHLVSGEIHRGFMQQRIESDWISHKLRSGP